MTDTPAERAAESTWTSMRRRKVVQWGVAYVAGAWGLLQGLAYATATFHWPEQVQQLTTLGLVVGLPAVLVVAYYHGDRGQQRITAPEFAILTLLLLLGGGAFWYYQRTTEAEMDEPAQTASTVHRDTSPAVSDARPSVAVLPFENRSDESKDAYFVDGIHDDILTQLSKVSALRVISRTSVEQFRDTKLPVKAIADQLGVSKILEGGVQRAGDRVRVTVQLIDAANDAHVWAESYDRELTAANIFSIQSDVAGAIASALKATLTPAEKTRVDAIPTQNLEAWEAYQLGKQRMAARTSAGLNEAEKHFRKAIARDPNFALAWVGLADTLSLQTVYSDRSKEPALREAEKAVARALELDPNLAEAWASAGDLAHGRLQLVRSEELFRRAIALNPNYATAHQWLGLLLTDLGRRDEALAEAERAVVLDPLSAIINNWLGHARANVGRFDEALIAYKQAIKIDSSMGIPYGSIGATYSYGFGRFDIAIPWYRKTASLDPGDQATPAEIARAHWELGDDAEADRWLARMPANGEGNDWANFVAALLYFDRGDEASARRHAQEAAKVEPSFIFLLRDDDLRTGDYRTARARYEKVFPQLFEKNVPKFTDRDTFAAIDLALVLQHFDEEERAKALLDRSEAYLRAIPRMGSSGYGIADVAISALRGDTTDALAKLREAEQAGWRTWWRYYRDFDPNLASIRNEPEFKAIFADIERDMARQRARLAARPKEAPLELTDASK